MTKADLQDNGKLFRRLLLAGPMLQPQLKGSQLLVEEGAGLKLYLPFML